MEREHGRPVDPAPDPEDPRKPDSPDDISGPGWRYTVRRTVREFLRDECTDLAAALTYYGVLAVAPALLALVSLLGVFGDGQQIIDRTLTVARDAGLPRQGLEALQPVIENLGERQGAGLGLVVGLLVALWSASGYVNAFSRAMNRMYEVPEGRPAWKLRPVLLAVTFGLLILVVTIVVALVLSGPVAEAVGSALGLSTVAVTAWSIAKWPVVAALAALAVAVLYWATPNVRQPRFRWISVGAVVALLTWALATAAFGVYLATIGGSGYAETYGTLAGVIVFLLWLWITNLALLFGAELDAELERTRELQGGIAAESSLQLPPRDTAAAEKKAARREDDVAVGRALRQGRGQRRDGRG